MFSYLGQTESWGGEHAGQAVVAGGYRINPLCDLYQEEVSVHDGTWLQVVVGAEWRE